MLGFSSISETPISALPSAAGPVVVYVTPPTSFSVNSGRTRIDMSIGISTININSGKTYINLNAGEPPE